MPPPVTTKILVLGDSMADWLAYGLEDALSETPEIGVDPQAQGILRSDPIRVRKPDAPEWSQVARESDRGGKTASHRS